jgi:hypothetical protein
MNMGLGAPGTEHDEKKNSLRNEPGVFGLKNRYFEAKKGDLKGLKRVPKRVVNESKRAHNESKRVVNES